MKYNLLFLLLYFSSTLAADGLGRLFLTPEQRAQLEILRAQRDRRLPFTADTEAAPPVAAPVPQGPEVVTYSGVVRRSDGKSTVWINGKPVNERGKGGGEIRVLGVRRDGAVAVAIPQADRRASLKVGQSLDVTSGTIEESYARRETLVRPLEKTPAVAAEAAAAATAATPDKPAPVRARDIREADPERGAAPAMRTPGK